MRWKPQTIGDFLALQRGHDLTEDQRTPGAVPIIGSAGPNGSHGTARAKGPGVAVGRSGASIGKVTFVGEDYWPHNTCLYVTDFKGNDEKFSYYLLKTLNLATLNSGAAQPSLNRNFVYGVKIRAPDVDIQIRVAGVLSEYDELIANNERRIALLERAARLLFEEWFVHLRYPGYLHDEVKDGLPSRWTYETLGEVSPLIYGKALKEEDRVQGKIAVYGSSGEVGFHDKKLVSAPAIIVGRKGNVGSVFWSPTDCWPIDTAYYVEPDYVSLFVYQLLQHQTFENSDAAVPGLNRDYAHRKKVKWPDKKLRDAYEAEADPVFKQRELLIRANQKLSQARDLLLPSLVDGRIAV